jgi:hypothetical protein
MDQVINLMLQLELASTAEEATAKLAPKMSELAATLGSARGAGQYAQWSRILLTVSWLKKNFS